MTSDDALFRAAATNLVVHATHSARTIPGARVRVETDLALVDSGFDSETFNVACRARLSRATAASRIDEALAFLGGPERPFSWWSGPGDTPAGLPGLLEEAGLRRSESLIGMSLELSRLHAPPLPTDFEIRRVRTPADLEAYAALLAGAVAPLDPHVTTYYERAADAFLDRSTPQRLYLGRVEGRPVATAELTEGGGAAGVYAVSTLKEVRGRGIGTAMTVRALLDARAAGHQIAVLQASAAGEGVYRRLGFAPFGTYVEFKPGRGAPPSGPGRVAG